MVDPMTRALPFLGGLTEVAGVEARFVGRVPGVPLSTDKGATLRLLEPAHRGEVEACGFSWEQLWRAEQVHGDGLTVVPVGEGKERLVEGADGLLTSCEGVLLGIYVADCAAVYLVDAETGALGLVHSGKKGTDLGIAVRAVERMENAFGTQRENLRVAVSPCIRPPHYEVDFVQEIQQQLRDYGIPGHQIEVSGICTATEVAAYYSYRIERGKTGRMLALLGRKEGSV